MPRSWLGRQVWTSAKPAQQGLTVASWQQMCKSLSQRAAERASPNKPQLVPLVLNSLARYDCLMHVKVVLLCLGCIAVGTAISTTALLQCLTTCPAGFAYHERSNLSLPDNLLYHNKSRTLACTYMQVTSIQSDDYSDIPNSQIKRITAKRLLESKQTVPHYYLTIDCRVDKLVQLRQQLNAGLAKDGKKLSVNDFIVKASAAVRLWLGS